MPKNKKNVQQQVPEKYSSGLLNRFQIGSSVNEDTRKKLEQLRRG